MSSVRIPPTASAVSSTIKHLGYNPRFFTSHGGAKGVKRVGGERRKFSITMSSPLEVCVKASVIIPNKLGDCKASFLFPSLVSFHFHFLQLGRLLFILWFVNVMMVNSKLLYFRDVEFGVSKLAKPFKFNYLVTLI